MVRWGAADDCQVPLQRVARFLFLSPAFLESGSQRNLCFFPKIAPRRGCNRESKGAVVGQVTKFRVEGGRERERGNVLDGSDMSR